MNIKGIEVHLYYYKIKKLREVGAYMNPEKKQQSPWKSSLIIGACAVIASITLLAIWCIPISISWRIILSVIQIIFIIVLLLHQTITHWEQLARRRTAITLQTLGSLLVIQVVATQALRVASTSAKMFVKTGESTEDDE